MASESVPKSVGNGKKVKPEQVSPRMSYFYCDGSNCAFQWDRKAIHEKLMIATPAWPSKSKEKLNLCQSCYEKWDKDQLNTYWNVQECDVELKKRFETYDTSISERLQSYKMLIANTKEYFFTVLIILLCLPLFAAIPKTFFRKRYKNVCKLWEAIPKGKTFVCFVAVYATYIMIALSCPFTPQIIFWVCMELYNVLFLCLNILSDTPINGYVNVDAQRRPKSTFGTISYAFFYYFMFPSFVLLDRIELVLRLPSVSIIASTTGAKSIDVKKLFFIDSETKEPLPSHLLPGAFTSLQAKKYASAKSVPTIGLSFIIAFGAYIFFLVLTTSWVTNISHNMEFLFPSAYALISSPLNPEYNITTFAPGKMCQVVPGTNGTQWKTLLNINIDPIPTKALGIPQLTLEFYSNSTLLTYMMDDAWNINIAQQNGDNVTLTPIDGQSTFTFLATFLDASNCSMITDNLTIKRKISYQQLSIQQYLRMNRKVGEVVPLYLLCKLLPQSVCVYILILVCTEALWNLWLYFDGITEIGLYSSSFENTSTKIDLGIVVNLCTWWQLRKSIAIASEEYTLLIKVMISLYLLQLLISFGGLLYYCIMGIAPMPTYFLLMIALAMSLAPLFFLYPISKIAQLQASHGDMLRDALMNHLVEKAQSSDQIDTKLEKYLTTFIDTIDNHDNRICFWGVEMSLERLNGLWLTLVSGIYFIASKTIQFSWSERNVFYDEYNPAKVYF